MVSVLAPEQIVEAATMLTEARRRGEPLEGLGSCTPTNSADAESISDEHAERLGRRVVGWKIGCTSERAMEILGSPGPFAGRIFADTVFESGEVPFAEFVSPRIETEFAFILGEDLPARNEPWTVSEVRQATQAIAPAFEIVAPRMIDFDGVGYLTLIADSGANGGIVLGDPVPMAELPLLAGVRVSLAIDGAEQTIGTDSGWRARPFYRINGCTKQSG